MDEESEGKLFKSTSVQPFPESEMFGGDGEFGS